MDLLTSDILLHTCTPCIPSSSILPLIQIIREGSRLYTTHDESQYHSIAHEISPAISSVDFPLGAAIFPVLREKFAAKCLNLLFAMCAESPEEPIPIRHRIAVLTFPLLIEKCEKVIRRYAADKPMFGDCPLPRCAFFMISVRVPILTSFP